MTSKDYSIPVSLTMAAKFDNICAMIECSRELRAMGLTIRRCDASKRLELHTFLPCLYGKTLEIVAKFSGNVDWTEVKAQR